MLETIQQLGCSLSLALTYGSIFNWVLVKPRVIRRESVSFILPKSLRNRCNALFFPY